MRLPDVGAIFAQHRKPIIVGGGGLAVLLGLRARSARSSAPAATAGGASGVATTTAYAGRGGVYDSTANDVYNSIQPQISSLAGSLSQLAADVAASKVGPQPSRAQIEAHAIISRELELAGAAGAAKRYAEIGEVWSAAARKYAATGSF